MKGRPKKIKYSRLNRASEMEGKEREQCEGGKHDKIDCEQRGLRKRGGRNRKTTEVERREEWRLLRLKEDL